MFEVTLGEYDGGKDLNWQFPPPKFQVSFQASNRCVMSVSTGARRTSCQGPMLLSLSYCLACCKKVSGLRAIPVPFFKTC